MVVDTPSHSRFDPAVIEGADGAAGVAPVEITIELLLAEVPQVFTS